MLSPGLEEDSRQLLALLNTDGGQHEICGDVHTISFHLHIVCLHIKERIRCNNREWQVQAARQEKRHLHGQWHIEGTSVLDSRRRSDWSIEIILHTVKGDVHDAADEGLHLPGTHIPSDVQARHLAS